MSQVVYPSTVIYLTKLHKKLLAILLFVVVVLQKGSKVARQLGVGLAVSKTASYQSAIGKAMRVGLL